MSLYIKGIGLPPSGEAYVIYPDGSLNRQVCGICQCGLDATAIELPPHGRLGDLDALTDTIERVDWYHQNEEKDIVHGANSSEHQAWYKEQDVYAAIEGAMTIIPADPAGDADNNDETSLL